jgi:hypothetical protein
MGARKQKKKKRFARLHPDDVRTLNEMRQWQRNFRLSGPRVRASNTPHGFTASVGDTPIPAVIQRPGVAVSFQVGSALSPRGAYNAMILVGQVSSIADAVSLVGGTDSSSSGSNGYTRPCVIINEPDIDATDASGDPIWPLQPGHTATGVIIGMTAPGDTPPNVPIVQCETYMSDYINCPGSSSSSSS